jgi:hypothetical protein
MISFFRKNSTAVLDCFTYVSYINEYAAISKAIKYLPDWWKQMPSTLPEEMLSIKKCPGFINFFKKGIVIPSWFELELTLSKDCKEKAWRWESSSKYMDVSDSHHNVQFQEFSGSNGQNIKITSPWLFKTKDDIDFVWSQPTWNMRENIFNLSILPAVINFKYQHSTNINFFAEYRKETRTYKIESLTPLVMLHPLSDKNIEIKTHLISENEFQQKREGINNFLFSRNVMDDLLKKNKKEKLHKKIKELEK